MFFSEIPYRFGLKKNRRKYPRMPAKNLVKLIKNKTGADLSEPIIFNMVDISEGGLRFNSAEPLARGQFLNLTINLASGERQMDATGEVMWAVSKPTSHFTQAGVFFKRLRENDAAHIRNYVTREVALKNDDFPFI